jgi:hypothetical protein
MFSSRNPFGLRLALWYAAVFSISSLVIVLLAYALTARSLAARDHQILQSKVGEYAAAYARGGIPALTLSCARSRLVTPERLLVRVNRPRHRGGVVLSNPQGWDPAHVQSSNRRSSETARWCRWGKSSESRNEAAGASARCRSSS